MRRPFRSWKSAAAAGRLAEARAPAANCRAVRRLAVMLVSFVIAPLAGMMLALLEPGISLFLRAWIPRCARAREHLLGQAVVDRGLERRAGRDEAAGDQAVAQAVVTATRQDRRGVPDPERLVARAGGLEDRARQVAEVGRDRGGDLGARGARDPCLSPRSQHLAQALMSSLGPRHSVALMLMIMSATEWRGSSEEDFRTTEKASRR